MNSHFWISFKRILNALGILVIVTLIGFIGFMVIEGYGPLDAFYMTIITMSTVGFGTIGELSPEGKMFVSILIIFAMGVFFYAITSLATFIVEGEIRQFFEKYKVDKNISKLKNHIIICGLGRNGRQSAFELHEEGKEFVLIEINRDKIDAFKETHPDFLVIEGDAREERTLENAKIEDAQGLIIALDKDADNVFVTLTARELNEKVNIVSRASNESSIRKLKRSGANEVVLPNRIGGRRMAKLITSPALVDFVDTISGQGKGRFELEPISVEHHKKLIGKNLIDLKIKELTGVMVVGVKNPDGDILINPSATRKIEKDDILFLLGKKTDLNNFYMEYS